MKKSKQIKPNNLKLWEETNKQDFEQKYLKKFEDKMT